MGLFGNNGGNGFLNGFNPLLGFNTGQLFGGGGGGGGLFGGNDQPDGPGGPSPIILPPDSDTEGSGKTIALVSVSAIVLIVLAVWLWKKYKK